MHKDQRHKNQLPSGERVEEFARDYFAMIQKASSQIDAKALEKAIQIIEVCVNKKGQVFVAGNGGSAAIANHLCCDWTKGTSHPQRPTIKTHSLVANTSLLTALANDISYEESISEQVEYLCSGGDVLILISSSGNSPNILKAAQTAKTLGISVIGMTGFTGGKLASSCDSHLHIPASNYGVVEDCHQSLMHIFAQYIARARDRS